MELIWRATCSTGVSGGDWLGASNGARGRGRNKQTSKQANKHEASHLASWMSRLRDLQISREERNKRVERAQ